MRRVNPRRKIQRGGKDGNVEVSPSSWVMQNTAAFPNWAADTFRYPEDGKPVDGYSHMVQQRFVRDYLQHDSPYRGLILYHGLGSGKTCSAIAASEALRMHSKKVFVMLPASLRDNYVREIKKCGSEAFREAQSWRRQGDDPVIWVPDGDGIPFEKLGEADRDQVRVQVDAAVQRTHTFISYNGLSTKRIDEMCDPSQPNAFDDAVVVIDEVHNFVSAVANARLLSRVYQRIMDAQRCKVVMLSGTPLVNEPHELALLVNLAHGYVRTHTFGLRSTLDDNAAAQLRACPDVHEIHEEPTGRSIVIRMLPDGFVRVDGGSGLVARADPELLEQLGPDGTRRIRDVLEQTAGITSHTTNKVLLLPVDPDVFRDNFVEKNSIANAHVLERRMLGTVSFFRGHAQSLYPKLRRMLIVRTLMSPRQFSEYTVQRTAEARKEDAARRFAGMRKNNPGGSAGMDSFAGLKPFSRLVCNFTFPEEVPRPRKGDFKVGEADEDGGDDEEHAAGDRGSGAYERALDAAADMLRSMPGRLALANGGLEELSPKFAAIVRRLLGVATDDGKSISRPARGPEVPTDVQRTRGATSTTSTASTAQRGGGGMSRGTSIVYSQFRRAEGVNLLAAALDANGFSQLRLVRPEPGAPYELIVESPDAGNGRYIVYDNSDRVAATHLLAIFNNKFDDLPPSIMRGLRAISKSPTNLRGELARVLLITRSGAEGISTRNVREVHVMEPFWHANRIEQVVGRARRAYSHADLPPSERTVDVYIYMASMTPQQAALHKRDAGKSADEFVHDVSQRKRVVLKGLYDIMRRAAVDCRLYPSSGKDECYAPPAGVSPEAPLYPVDLAEDVRAARPAKLVAVRVDGALFYADMESGVLYDHEAIRLHNRVVRVGKMP